MRNNTLIDKVRSPQKSLKELIEHEYLKYTFKPNTHTKTNALHIFNELWSSDFLKGDMDRFGKNMKMIFANKTLTIN